MESRHFLLLIIFSLAFFCADAQDIIQKRSGEEIQAVVVDITPGVVKYRKFEKQDGPIYSIARGEVEQIRYESGKIIFFEEEVPAEDSPAGKDIPVHQKPSPTIGWHIGLGASDLYGDIMGHNIQFASALGAAFTLPAGRNNSIMAEVDLLSLGCGLDDFSYYESDSSLVEFSKLRQDMGYISLLLTDRYFFNSGRNYYLEGGFYASFLMNASISGEANITDTLGVVTSGTLEDTMLDLYKAYDLGLAAGLGGRIPLDKKNKWHLTAGARFYYGLTNIADFLPDYRESNIFGMVFVGVDIPTRSSD